MRIISFIFKAFVVMKWPLFDLKVAMKLNRPYNAIGISANKLGSKVSSSSDINLQCQSIILLRTGDLTCCISSYIRIEKIKTSIPFFGLGWPWVTERIEPRLSRSQRSNTYRTSEKMSDFDRKYMFLKRCIQAKVKCTQGCFNMILVLDLLLCFRFNCKFQKNI